MAEGDYASVAVADTGSIDHMREVLLMTRSPQAGHGSGTRIINVVRAHGIMMWTAKWGRHHHDHQAPDRGGPGAVAVATVCAPSLSLLLLLLLCCCRCCRPEEIASP